MSHRKHSHKKIERRVLYSLIIHSNWLRCIMLLWVTKILISKLSYQKSCNYFACFAPSLTLLYLIIWSRNLLTRFTLCTALLLECAPNLYSWTEQVNKVSKMLLAFIHTLQLLATSNQYYFASKAFSIPRFFLYLASILKWAGRRHTGPL